MHGKQKMKNTCVVWLGFSYELKHTRMYFLDNLLTPGKYMNKRVANTGV